jgi:cell division protein FtsX
MKFLPLVWAGLMRKRVRTVLAMISVAIAFWLYGTLDGVTAAFDDALIAMTSEVRLRTQSRQNVRAGLPLAHRARIEAVPGVRDVGFVTFVGGLYQDSVDFIEVSAIDIERVGDIGFIVNSIIGAVLFALLFVTGNTMMQSIRERIPELAVLKTYGFSNLAVNLLVFAESALLCVTAAVVGLVTAALLFPTMFDAMGVAPIPMEKSVLVGGVALAVAMAAVSAWLPTWRAQRLNVVDALAGR